MQVCGVQDKSIIIFDILKSDDERIMYLFFIINIIINYTYLFYYLQKNIYWNVLFNSSHNLSIVSSSPHQQCQECARRSEETYQAFAFLHKHHQVLIVFTPTSIFYE